MQMSGVFHSNTNLIRINQWLLLIRVWNNLQEQRCA